MQVNEIFTLLHNRAGHFLVFICAIAQVAVDLSSLGPFFDVVFAYQKWHDGLSSVMSH